MKKVNSLSIILIFSCILANLSCIGQSIPFVKDTVYVFIFKGALENDRPIVSYAITKDLSGLERLSSITDQDSFMCAFFKQSILFEEPVFTLSKNASLYNYQTEKEKNNGLKKLSKSIDKLNASYSAVTSKNFSNGKTIELKCAKLVGEFWELPKKKDELNSYSHSFYVNENCYEKDYIYNLKDISVICKLTPDEINTIRSEVK